MSSLCSLRLEFFNHRGSRGNSRGHGGYYSVNSVSSLCSLRLEFFTTEVAEGTAEGTEEFSVISVNSLCSLRLEFFNHRGN